MTGLEQQKNLLKKSSSAPFMWNDWHSVEFSSTVDTTFQAFLMEDWYLPVTAERGQRTESDEVQCVCVCAGDHTRVGLSEPRLEGSESRNTWGMNADDSGVHLHLHWPLSICLYSLIPASYKRLPRTNANSCRDTNCLKVFLMYSNAWKLITSIFLYNFTIC